MRFQIEKSDRYINTYYLVDTRNYNSVIDEFNEHEKAEMQCEILNEVYESGFEDGKDYVLNGEI